MGVPGQGSPNTSEPTVRLQEDRPPHSEVSCLREVGWRHLVDQEELEGEVEGHTDRENLP